MKLVMTMMVRDEADIIAPTLEHHLAQGVDRIIVTDNGSTDGTGEILERFAERGSIDLRHDPVHRKQQSEVVTGMARDAARLYGADWVVNADADEFWLPVDRALTLRDVFEQLDPAIQAFTVDVVDMIGAPAQDGTGLQRLVYRDLRSQDAMNRVGVFAHATPDAVHVGDPEIVVHQGNHFVSLASRGAPPEPLRLEVLHVPWRSWAQFSHKVAIAGRAYDANPELTPSANHHGMRDYGRLKSGLLLPSYIARHPTPDELERGLASGDFAEERVIADTIDSPVSDIAFSPDELESARLTAAALHAADYRAMKADREVIELKAALRAEHDRAAAIELEAEHVRLELDTVRQQAHAERLRGDVLDGQLTAMRNRRVVRLVDGVSRTVRRIGSR
jgi:hypothetical protein